MNLKEAELELKKAHLQLDIACWQHHIIKDKLSVDDLKLYEDSIKEAKEKLAML